MRKPTRRDIWSDPAAARERLRASSAAWNYGEPQEEEGYFLVAWRRGDRAVVGVPIGSEATMESRSRDASDAAYLPEFSCGDGVEVAHPPTSGGGGGSIPTSPLVLFDLAAVYTDSFMERGTTWRRASVEEVNGLLAEHHYLGPLKSGGKLIFAGTVDDEIVACQIWRHPTSRRLPQDGTWLELSRWCLTPSAGLSAGSRMHKYVARWIKSNCPEVTTLVSYSDPSQGHTGALYRSCNWYWAPTWLRLRPPPSGNGAWSGNRQQVKDRWIFDVRPDLRRAEIIRVKDDAIVKRLEAERASAEEAA